MAGNAVIRLMSSFELHSILLDQSNPSFVETHVQPPGCCVSLCLSLS